MADSDITVSGLTLGAGIDYNIAKWSYVDPHANGGLDYLKLAAVELWAAASNDRSLASKVNEGLDQAPHMAIGESTTRYYWIKPRNKSGLYGDWYPAGATSGVQGTTAVIGAGEAGLPDSWTSYTPTISSTTNSLGGVTNVSGRYAISGNVCFINIQFEITNNGTGAGSLKATLPSGITAPSSAFPGSVGSGRRNDGPQLYALAGSSATGGLTDSVTIFKYDGTYPGAVAVFSITLMFELSQSWTSFDTFAVASSAGSVTTVGNKRGRYKKLGRVLIFNFDFTITTNGSGSGNIKVDLPISSGSVIQSPQGAVATNSGVLASGYCGFVSSGTPATQLTIQGYDGSYLGQNGATIRGTLVYEI